jgi:NADPH:quinone reductase-like Zn-dependent oxidoreductase
VVEPYKCGTVNANTMLRAVDTADVAVVPDSVDLGAASTLPVAGVTALQSLRRLGNVMGRRVLVTGASGGVGRFAVQLAARSGANVIASVGSPARGAELSDIGASEVAVGLHEVTGRLFGVLDMVGGPQLANVLGMLDEGGRSNGSGAPRVHR